MTKTTQHPATVAAPGYGLGMIGAAVFYLHTSYGLWGSVGALLKALVWPAYLVYHVLGL